MILSFFFTEFSFISFLSALHKFDKRSDQLNLDDHCVQHQITFLSNSKMCSLYEIEIFMSQNKKSMNEMI